MRLEAFAEEMHVLIAGGQPHMPDAHIGGRQQLAGALHPKPGDIPERRGAGLLPEQHPVAGNAQILHPGKPGERDPRMKERKKYGLKAARRAPQFSKR